MSSFRHRLLALPLVALITGCVADPAKRCAGPELRERATVDQLIMETRRNIERGYVLVEEDRNVGINLCLGGQRSNVGLSFCTDPANRRQARAIDVPTETRKLDALLARRQVLDQRIAQLSAVCPMR